MKKALLLVICCIASTVLTSCKIQDKLFEKQTQSENMVFDNSEFDDIAANFEKALQSDPDFAQNYINLADSYISAGYPDKAITVLYRGYDKTHDAVIESKINDFFTKYKFDFIALDDNVQCDNTFTLSEFNDLKSADYFDFNAGIVLVDNKTQEKTLISIIKLKGVNEWNFTESDLDLVGRHFDKLLISAYYGPGQNVSFIYDVFKNSIEELSSGLTFGAYSNGYLDCSEDFIFASPKAYDVESFVTLYWYDWNGNVIYQISNASSMFTDDKLLYMIREEDENSRAFKIYSSDYDGKNAVLMSTIKGENSYKSMYCFFWDENEIKYGFTDQDGNNKEESMSLKDMHDVYLK